ncbi:MAG TPA: hypothetical protein VF367_04065 [Candidatus Limnocylindria bacterium]
MGTARPARITGAAVLLSVVVLLAVAYVIRGVLGYFDQGAIGTRMPFPQFLVSAPNQVAVPITVAGLAGAATVGILRRRAWGRLLALAIAVAFLGSGLLLTIEAIRGWGVAGSFAVLVVPLALVALLCGGFVMWATWSTRAHFDGR